MRGAQAGLRLCRGKGCNLGCLECGKLGRGQRSDVGAGKAEMDLRGGERLDLGCRQNRHLVGSEPEIDLACAERCNLRRFHHRQFGRRQGGDLNRA